MTRTKEQLEPLLHDVFAAHPVVVAAYLFGSTARGTARTDSDIDVAVLLDPVGAALARPPWGHEAHLAVELGRALRTDGIDVVVLNTAGPMLKRQTAPQARRPAVLSSASRNGEPRPRS